MSFDMRRCRDCLVDFDFEKLFIEELGWDHHSGRHIIDLVDRSYVINAVAQKRRVQFFECRAEKDNPLPDYNTRKKIEKQISKIAFEHLVVFTDADRTIQIWQWVARAPGKPDAYREISYHPKTQSGDLLLQKLSTIRFTLDEEESIDIVGVTHRLRDAFDRDTVTKKFYNRFKEEHQAFLNFIEGIIDKGDREWYASLMLNRLMFVWFIQQKGFLDNDTDYLQNRLDEVRRQKGRGKFHTFYRVFLLALFHQGFARRQEERDLDPELTKLLGRVPYLNGGLFDPHQLETENTDLHIPDEAFQRLFDFFNQYDWHLDTRVVSQGNEINPDVLGYIFEKYINQKQMGAYYTKEDITEYISKNTIIPFLFDAAKKKCAVAFETGSALWRLLSENPDRYISRAMRIGVIDDDGAIIPLPPEIEEGVDISKPNLLDRRKNWNQPAAPEYALPTEIWREHVARRQRCLEIREKLQTGEVEDINDLITYNLDIRQFVEDVIADCEGPDLLRSFWQAIRDVTILDPTCGSGAFLFAALEILHPLYEACLTRMKGLVDDLDRSGEKHSPMKFSDFRQILNEIESHPNRDHFILKSIIIRNLYGVDIMDEAVEICKLRLFLKLVSQVETVNQLEPLPDIDFNIRAGNTLVGFTSLEDVKKAVEGDMIKLTELPEIEEKAEDAAKAYRLFLEMQTVREMSSSDFRDAKQNLRKKLLNLEKRLNEYLAGEYGVTRDNIGEYVAWIKTYHPFHWMVEFYTILQKGGFDIIIGNPPYLELRQVSYKPKNFVCLEGAAVHSICIERSVQLLNKNGCMSMIVPLALPSTQRMQIVQKIIETAHNTWYANFSWRPAKLFDTVNRALTIFVITPSINGNTYSTNYQKWVSDNREGLFNRINYMSVQRKRSAFWVPKISETIEQNILSKCLSIKTKVQNFIGRSQSRIYYRTDGGLYWKVFTNFPPMFRLNGIDGHSSRETSITISDPEFVIPVIAALSSDIFWWWYTVTSNVRHLNPYDVQNYPLPASILKDADIKSLGEVYLRDINDNSTMLIREQKQTGRTETQSFKIQKSKDIIDKIDKLLSQHYKLTEEELDFIINYDIKYRMGLNGTVTEG
jgi:hypothetical protein